MDGVMLKNVESGELLLHAIEDLQWYRSVGRTRI